MENGIKKVVSNLPIPDLDLLADYMSINQRSSSSELKEQIVQKFEYVYSNNIPNSKCMSFTKKFSQKDLETIRSKIYQIYKKYEQSVYKMSEKDLYDIFQIYDTSVFDGNIEKYVSDSNFKLTFRKEGEPTFTTEGICAFEKCEYIVTIPLSHFNGINGIKNVAGHLCKNQLECLVRVIEHEIVHLIIFMHCNQDLFVTNQHGDLFMTLVKDLFGHTDYRHYMF